MNLLVGEVDMDEGQRLRFFESPMKEDADRDYSWACSCAVPGKDLHNNTIRILERSLQAAGTDGYADTESGTSSRCAVRVPKGYRD